jgi:hypothetical protein
MRTPENSFFLVLLGIEYLFKFIAVWFREDSLLHEVLEPLSCPDIGTFPIFHRSLPMPLPVFEVAIIINQSVWSIGPTIALPFPRGVGSGIDKTAMESNLSWAV